MSRSNAVSSFDPADADDLAASGLEDTVRHVDEHALEILRTWARSPEIVEILEGAGQALEELATRLAA